MIGLLIVGIILLIGIIVVQIGKVTELAAKIRGVEAVEHKSNESQARYLVIFLVGFLIFTVVSALYYKNSMLGYGPHESASLHGSEIDSLFNVTLFFTGIVFVLTHIALFWYSYKYRRSENRVGKYFVHDTKLELIWTIIPAIVMVYLVTNGLVVWNDVMPDVDPSEEIIEFEATGYQFAWDLRYPGGDGKLGTKNYKLIDLANNPLGQDWTDKKNIDDFHPTEIYLPVGKKVRVRITAKDVLHNFYLPHFRLKMDAIPGLPTYFVFTPVKTTEEYREELSKYPEWQVPADPADPQSPQRWELFDYELACAELCGKGHYSMRRVVKIVSEEEYNAWTAAQTSYYVQNIRNTDIDPFRGELLDYEINARAKKLTSDFESALILDDPSTASIALTNVFFNTGSAELRENSKYELDNIASILNEYKDVSIEISGHTDNTGNADANKILSQERANSVTNYLVNKGISNARLKAIGYGQNVPADTNETEEGRQNNRRIEMKIISQSI
jgi:cytochrome c oxidase subunit II